MADWVKRIHKSCSGDLQPGEQVLAAALLQPHGNSKRLAMGAAGGALGVLVASKLRRKDDGTLVSDEGIAATIPDGTIVMGLTGGRVLLFGQAAMSGRPKELKATLARNDIAAIELGTGTAFRDVTIAFSDGTGRRFETPGLDKSIERLAAQFD